MRVFFALWPGQRTRAAIADAAAALLAGRPGRPVAAGNYHLTLEFLGEVETAAIEALTAIADGLPAARFRLSLDRSGHFDHAGICWLGPSAPPPGLTALQASLRDRLSDAGFPVDRRAFHPHVTIARGCRRPPDADPDPPVGWDVGGFVLCASRMDATYAVLARYGHGTGEL